MNFIELKLSPEELDDYRQHKKEYNFKKISKFINKVAADTGRKEAAVSYNPVIDRNLRTLERFYEIAGRRDDAFFRNALKVMEERGEERAVLIAGGFHTGNLMPRFKDKDFSYVVISPRIEKETDYSLYHSLLRGDPEPRKSGAAPKIGFLRIQAVVHRVPAFQEIASELIGRYRQFSSKEMVTRMTNLAKVFESMEKALSVDEKAIELLRFQLDRGELKFTPEYDRIVATDAAGARQWEFLIRLGQWRHLSRRAIPIKRWEDGVILDDDINVMVFRTRFQGHGDQRQFNQARLVTQAPREVRIYREEVYRIPVHKRDIDRKAEQAGVPGRLELGRKRGEALIIKRGDAVIKLTITTPDLFPTKVELVIEGPDDTGVVVYKGPTTDLQGIESADETSKDAGIEISGVERKDVQLTIRFTDGSKVSEKDKESLARELTGKLGPEGVRFHVPKSLSPESVLIYYSYFSHKADRIIESYFSMWDPADSIQERLNTVLRDARTDAPEDGTTDLQGIAPEEEAARSFDDVSAYLRREIRSLRSDLDSGWVQQALSRANALQAGIDMKLKGIPTYVKTAISHVLLGKLFVLRTRFSMSPGSITKAEIKEKALGALAMLEENLRSFERLAQAGKLRDVTHLEIVNGMLDISLVLGQVESVIPSGKNALLSDKSIPLVCTTPVPQGKRVAVLEAGVGEARTYSDMLIQQFEEDGRDVRYYHIADDGANRKKLVGDLGEFNPDIILLPQHEDRRSASVELRQILYDSLGSIKGHVSKVVIGYDTPQRIFNYNLYCPLTKEEWDVVREGMAQHVSQMERVAYDEAVDAQARANAILLRTLVEPELPEEFEYVLLYNLKRIVDGNVIPVEAGQRFIYHPSEIGSLRSFYPVNSDIVANAPHADDTEIGLGSPFALSSRDALNNRIFSYVAAAGWRVPISGIDDSDSVAKVRRRVKEAKDGARVLGINTEFLTHPESLDGIGLPFYEYRLDNDMPREERDRLISEERAIVADQLRQRYAQFMGRDKKGTFILCNPEESDKHPDHQISRRYWLDAATELTAELGGTIWLQEFISPWAGDFNAYRYSEETPDVTDEGLMSRAAILSSQANAPPGEELLLEGGFAGKPQHLGKLAQRFMVRTLDEELREFAKRRTSTAITDLQGIEPEGVRTLKATDDAELLAKMDQALKRGSSELDKLRKLVGEGVIRYRLEYDRVIAWQRDMRRAEYLIDSDTWRALGGVITGHKQGSSVIVGSEVRATVTEIFRSEEDERITGAGLIVQADGYIYLHKVYVDPAAKKNVERGPTRGKTFPCTRYIQQSVYIKTESGDVIRLKLIGGREYPDDVQIQAEAPLHLRISREGP
ncbi:MAG: carbon storage regulator, partial [Candidatus Omnitrophota bacterium]